MNFSRIFAHKVQDIRSQSLGYSHTKFRIFAHKGQDIRTQSSGYSHTKFRIFAHKVQDIRTQSSGYSHTKFLNSDSAVCTIQTDSTQRGITEIKLYHGNLNVAAPPLLDSKKSAIFAARSRQSFLKITGTKKMKIPIFYINKHFEVKKFKILSFYPPPPKKNRQHGFCLGQREKNEFLYIFSFKNQRRHSSLAQASNQKR